MWINIDKSRIESNTAETHLIKKHSEFWQTLNIDV